MRLLDLFCGAGGAAVGYQRAGFEVTGVDDQDQPSYPFRFIKADFMDVIDYARDFDVIHASPPCQAYSITKSIRGGSVHLKLIDDVRGHFGRLGKPLVIENVIGAPLINPILLCGTMFGLRVFRHRLFECESYLLLAPSHNGHDGTTGAHRGYSTARSGRNGFLCVAGHNFERGAGERAMGIDWMRSRRELAQAIPPAYTEYIGRQLLAAIQEAA